MPPRGIVSYTAVRSGVFGALGGDSVAIRSTELAGVAHLDAQGRMLSYSGKGTTYLQVAQRIADVPDVGKCISSTAAW